MSYQALCSFDLKNATYDDYQNAYADLAVLGFRHTAQGGTGAVILPTTTVIGEFTSASAASARDDLRAKVVRAFNARGFSSEVFIAVGGQDHTWGSHRT
jgi:hypothetical protein